MMTDNPEARAAIDIARALLAEMGKRGLGVEALGAIHAATTEIDRRDPGAGAFLAAVLARVMRPA